MDTPSRPHEYIAPLLRRSFLPCPCPARRGGFRRVRGDFGFRPPNDVCTGGSPLLLSRLLRSSGDRLRGVRLSRAVYQGQSVSRLPVYSYSCFKESIIRMTALVIGRWQCSPRSGVIFSAGCFPRHTNNMAHSDRYGKRWTSLMWAPKCLKSLKKKN
mgnify:CR=1 FL=1